MKPAGSTVCSSKAGTNPPPENGSTGAKSLTIATVNGTQKPVEGRLFSAIWNKENALVLMIDTRVGSDEICKYARVRREEIIELKAILDTATDGVIVLTIPAAYFPPTAAQRRFSDTNPPILPAILSAICWRLKAAVRHSTTSTGSRTAPARAYLTRATKRSGACARWAGPPIRYHGPH